MELAPTPRRRRWSGGAVLVLVAVVLAPVTALAVVPSAVGLERYVISGDELGGTVGRGSVVFERRVPIGDVAEGDVVTYPADGDAEGVLVTRRVVAVGDGVLRTGADGSAAASTAAGALDMVAFADHSTIPRVILALPWVGYPFLGGLNQPGWGVVALALGVLLGALCVRVGDRRAPRTLARASG